MSKSRLCLNGLLLMIMMSAFTIIPVLANQDYMESSKESASPEAVAAPEFALIPVGDHPNGYFSPVTLAPGTSTQLTVAIVNVGKIPTHLYTYKVNATSGANGGFVPGEEADPMVGSTAWIDYPSVSLDLAPDSQHEIEFSISVPPGTNPGQYVTGLMVETQEPLPIPGTDDLKQVLGYSISVEIVVPGERVTSFRVDNPETRATAQARSIRIPLVNTGNYLVRPTGELDLLDLSGNKVLTSPIEMGSVYGGLSTTIEVALPEQMASGDYTVDLLLTDPASGATAEIRDAPIRIEEPKDPTGVSVASVSMEPNAEEIIFANVDLVLENGGQQLSASDVTLQVLRDGKQVDEFPLARNQVLLSGENAYTARYIPADMWESGAYTFRIVVSAVDPNGGQMTILLDEDLDAEIVVP